MTQKKPPVFIYGHGLQVRTGTNYLGKLLSYHPEVSTVPPNRTNGEFPLLRVKQYYLDAFAAFQKKYFSPKELLNENTYKKHMAAAWENYLTETFDFQTPYVFVKDPNVIDIVDFFNWYPNSKLIILLRDGRDTVSSCLKASIAKRKKMGIKKYLKRRINYYSGRAFILYCIKWKKTVHEVSLFQKVHSNAAHKNQYFIVRYEDLFLAPDTYIPALLRFCELNYSPETITTMKNADVVGSSFYGKDKKESAPKPNWEPTQKSKDFQPVGRWKKWSPLKKWVFKRIAGKELIALDYEKNSTW